MLKTESWIFPTVSFLIWFGKLLFYNPQIVTHAEKIKLEIDKGTIPTGFATPTITCVLPRTGSHELLVLIKFRSRELETISKTFY